VENKSVGWDDFLTSLFQIIIGVKMINIIDIELQLIFEEVVKLPRTTDTSYVTPDVLELVDERFFDWENTK
jgi:hypothetical protein